MNLPKGTEHFMTDIHGEYEAFNHVLRNGSGTIRNKIEEVYGDKLSENEKKELAAIIYYPKEKVEIMQNKENFNAQISSAQKSYFLLIDNLDYLPLKFLQGEVFSFRGGYTFKRNQ